MRRAHGPARRHAGPAQHRDLARRADQETALRVLQFLFAKKSQLASKAVVGSFFAQKNAKLPRKQSKDSMVGYFAIFLQNSPPPTLEISLHPIQFHFFSQTILISLTLDKNFSQ